MYAKEDLFVTMEPLPELGINQYTIECTACSKGCTFHFRNHRKLPFAFVVSLAGAFSSPCRKLEKENARRYWPVLENLGTPDAADFRLAGDDGE